MAQPPETPPHSDIEGVNKDARAGSTSKDDRNPGGKLDQADKQSKAQPDSGGR